jgi:hypothetical protein
MVKPRDVAQKKQCKAQRNIINALLEKEPPEKKFESMGIPIGPINSLGFQKLHFFGNQNFKMGQRTIKIIIILYIQCIRLIVQPYIGFEPQCCCSISILTFYRSVD